MVEEVVAGEGRKAEQRWLRKARRHASSGTDFRRLLESSSDLTLFFVSSLCLLLQFFLFYVMPGTNCTTLPKWLSSLGVRRLAIAAAV